MRYCLNVHGVMLCDGPQHHEGGCTFTQGWQLARKLEDELASIAGYAGDTTNELRETRERVEAAEAERDRLRAALERAPAMILTIEEYERWYITCCYPALRGGV